MNQKLTEELSGNMFITSLKWLFLLIILYIIVQPIYELKIKGKKRLYTIKPSKKEIYTKLLLSVLMIIINILNIQNYETFIFVDTLFIYFAIANFIPTMVFESGIFINYKFYPYHQIISASFSNNKIAIRVKTGKYGKDTYSISCGEHDISNIKKILFEKEITIL